MQLDDYSLFLKYMSASSGTQRSLKSQALEVLLPKLQFESSLLA